MRGLVSEPVLNNPSLWPLLYLPTLVGISLATLFLKIASRPLKLLLRRPQSRVMGGNT
jgi:lipopolysaccharide export system permease protein